MTTDSEFQDEMVSLYQRTGQAFGYWPSRFLSSVRKSGGLAVAKKLLVPERVSTGFDRLVEAGRADLSVESIAVSERYSHLFTQEELHEARRRLSLLPESAFPTKIQSQEPTTLGEVTDNRTYQEAAIERVTVNRYERDPRARAACIREHGFRCKVCDFDFEERYGEPGKGFIHVHHTRALHRMRANNRVDPRRDLVPVCPNCHAMLHRRDPPYDVEQLKALLRPL